MYTEIETDPVLEVYSFLHQTPRPNKTHITGEPDSRIMFPCLFKISIPTEAIEAPPPLKNVKLIELHLQDRALSSYTRRNVHLPYETWQEFTTQQPYISHLYYEHARLDLYRHLKKSSGKAVDKLLKHKRYEEWKRREMEGMRRGRKKFWFWLRT